MTAVKQNQRATMQMPTKPQEMFETVSVEISSTGSLCSTSQFLAHGGSLDTVYKRKTPSIVTASSLHHFFELHKFLVGRDHQLVRVWPEGCVFVLRKKENAKLTLF